MGASPCTSNGSSVPPKFIIMPLFNLQVKVGRDAVNFIYCIANFSATPVLFLLPFLLRSTVPSFKIFSVSFSVVPEEVPEL